MMGKRSFLFHRLMIALGCALLVVPIGPRHLAAADNKATEDLILQAQTYRKNNQADSAIALARRALITGGGDSILIVINDLLGWGYLQRGDYDACDSAWSWALRTRENSSQPEDSVHGALLANMGSLFFMQAKYAEAEPYYSRALDVKRAVFGENHLQTAIGMGNLAAAFSGQFKYPQAEPLYQKALAILEIKLGPDHVKVATTLRNLAIALAANRKYDEAEKAYKRAIPLYEKNFGLESEGLANVLDNLAVLYVNLGRYQEAETFDQRALAIREKILGPDHPDVALNYSNVGAIYYMKGMYWEAIPYLEKALAIRKKILPPDDPDLATSLSNLSGVLGDAGRFDEALTLQRQALAIEEKVLKPDDPLIAISLQDLGVLYFDMKRYAEAEPIFKRALAIREKVYGPDDQNSARSLDNLAGNYLGQGRFAEARKLESRAVQIMEKSFGTDHPDVAMFQYHLGNICSAQGDYLKAESLYTISLATREKTLAPVHPYMAMNIVALAESFAASGDFAHSLPYYQKFLASRKTLFSYAFAFSSEQQKLNWVSRFPLIQQSLLSVALADGKDESRKAAFDMVLQGKSLVIDALTAERKAAYCTHDSTVVRDLDQRNIFSTAIARLAIASIQSDLSAAQRDSLQALSHQLDSLDVDLIQRCAGYKDVLADKNASLAAITAALPTGAALWEFLKYAPFHFRKNDIDEDKLEAPRYLAFTLTAEGTVTMRDLGDAQKIDSLIMAGRKIMDNAGSRLYTSSAAGLEDSLRQIDGTLFSILGAPLIAQLGSRTDIFISPDGMLNLWPFEIMPLADGKYMVEKYRLSYVSSGRDLVKFAAGRPSEGSAVVIADPDFSAPGVLPLQALKKDSMVPSVAISYMPPEPARGTPDCIGSGFAPLRHTREEAAAVAAALVQNGRFDVRTYYGQDATEEMVKAIASPTVLHFATHGFYCPLPDSASSGILDNPLLHSGIALVGANRVADHQAIDHSGNEDGILTAFEVSGLDLTGTELVTLSACETGIGQTSSGEGVFGLRRAFFHAGAKSIVSSLWKTPDSETAELMIGFYAHWLGGMTKRDALRQSELDMLAKCRKERGNGYPLFWGGFVLAGNPN